MIRSAFHRHFSSVSKYVDLTPWRSIVAIKGKDSSTLLQGVVSNDMDNLLHVKSQYAMLMNAKGRVMFDILMYQMEKDEIFIECDRSIAEKVRKHLSMYKIRKKVKVEHLSSHPVGHIFDNSEDVNDGVFIDPRVGNFGKRSLIGNVNNVETECLENYHSKRYQFGIAEGHEEIIFDKSFPLESNLDYMSGISLHKGCYLGQELTARTFHTGVTRKRILPIKIDPSNNELEFRNVKNRRAGKVLVKNDEGFGLALFRVENLEKPVSLGDEKNIIISAPDWWKRKDEETILFGIPDRLSHLDYANFTEFY